MTKRFILVSTIVAAMFAVAGCGDSSDDDNEKICESLCDNSSCGDLDELRGCEDDCVDWLEDVDCSGKARDAFECIDDDDCDFEFDCADEWADWVECEFDL